MSSYVPVLFFFCLLPWYAVAGQATIFAPELRNWLDGPEPPLVLDVRGRADYLSGTLPGAVNAGRDPKGYLPESGEEPVVVILPADADTALLNAWQRRLFDAGHRAWFLVGGLDAWKEVGGDVVVPEAGYAKPGRIPFVIPRGLCEGNEPAHVFE